MADNDTLYRGIFDVFVPKSVQEKSPFAARLYDQLAAHSVVARGLKTFAAAHAESDRSLEQTAVDLLSRGDKDVRAMINVIYDAIAKHLPFYIDWLGRPITAGGEQCPYWDTYDQPPKLAD